MKGTKTMTQYRPNLARKLRRLPAKFSSYPEVAVMTTEVVLHMIKQEHGLPAEAVRSAQDALTDGLEDDAIELVEKAWSLLPERHQDDPVVPWIAKQINTVMKAIDAHDRSKAERVLEELGEHREDAWLEVLVDVLKLRAAALARWARGSGGDLGRRTLQQALDAMGAA